MSEKSKTIIPFHALEASLAEFPALEFELTEQFLPGLYIRTVTIPAGGIFTSMKHKTNHPFVMTKGKIRMASSTEGEVTYEAPLMGVTEAGTQRLVYVEEECTWTTYHATDLTDTESIAAEILEPHQNPLIEAGRSNHWRNGKELSCPS